MPGPVADPQVLPPLVDFFSTTGKGTEPKAAMDRLITVWDKCSKMAADYGLNVCWEFEPGFVFNKPSEIVKLVDAVRAKAGEVVGVAVLIDRTGGTADFGVPFFACLTLDLESYDPERCPQCAKGVPLTIT